MYFEKAILDYSQTICVHKFFKVVRAIPDDCFHCLVFSLLYAYLYICDENFGDLESRVLSGCLQNTNFNCTIYG